MSVQPRAHFRQADAARGAVQERTAHFPLEAPDRPADRGGAGAQLPGGGGEAVVFHHGGEHAQVGQQPVIVIHGARM